jgi:hypothetical protein
MARFAELLQKLPLMNLPADTWEGLRTLLRQAPVIVIDNVYDYLMAYAGNELPYAMTPPPFPRFWMEYSVSVGAGRTIHLGAMFMETERNNATWNINMAAFTYATNENFASCLATRTFKLDSKGNQIAEKEHWNQTYPREGHTPEQFWDHLYSFTSPFMLALMFMHSKSVRRIEHVPPARLAKRNAERGKPPMLTYQTLEIKPLKEILIREGHVKSEGLERALHLCRGHFAFYPEGGSGLFGRRKTFGLIWIPAHARGTEKKGVVVSDYSVNAPRPPKEEAS